MGLHTVAVYSEADRDALHVAMADEAVLIGPPPPADSYLDAGRIIDACRRTGAQAVHPGYGFLSENASFARQCADNAVVFIGPPVAAIEAMGSKSAAKRIMEEAGVPLVPGFHGADPSDEKLKAEAERMGYPVLLKAVAGGGGKGMRRLDSVAEFDQALKSARREARAAFGDEKMLIEKFLQRPRHVEIQVFCDGLGGAVYLFERDCSVQRRHQKIIEEAPAPGLDERTRREMGEAAVRAARAIDYRGAGTVEFLLDGDGSFFFMEMNTRLQVEHPVTEMITGLDLVEWQLRVAAGEPLPLQQSQLQLNGHAFEARIYAEDPENGFLPATGRIRYYQPPPENDHVRVDSGVLQGDEVSVHYDPMIAKLVTWDENRDRALSRLRRALEAFRIGGVTTNIPFLYTLSGHEAFMAAELDTQFIERHEAALFHRRDSDHQQYLPLASLYLLLRMEQQARSRTAAGDPWSPWNDSTAWRLNQPAVHRGAIVMHGEAHSVPVREVGDASGRRFRMTVGGRTVMASGRLEGNELEASIDGHRRRVTVVPGEQDFTLFAARNAVRFALAQPDLGDEAAGVSQGAFAAPMNGVVVKCLVEPGEVVEKGEPVIVIEAMKMEHTLRAHAPGVVAEFCYQPGDQVVGGAELLIFEEK
jgi:3-methylcrotonyl-CoA carboxylase alpha subunit